MWQQGPAGHSGGGSVGSTAPRLSGDHHLWGHLQNTCPPSQVSDPVHCGKSVWMPLTRKLSPGQKQRGGWAGTGTAGKLTQGSLARFPLNLLDLSVSRRQSPLQGFGKHWGKGHPSSRSILRTGGKHQAAAVAPGSGTLVSNTAGWRPAKSSEPAQEQCFQTSLVRALVTLSSGDAGLLPEAPGHHEGCSQLYSHLHLHHQLPQVASPPVFRPLANPCPFTSVGWRHQRAPEPPKTFALVTELGTRNGLNVFKQLQNG